MRSRATYVVIGAVTALLLAMGTAAMPTSAVTPLGQFTTVATAGDTPGFDANSDPRAITTGPDGLMWFTDFGSVNRVNEDGSVTRFDAEPVFGPNPSLFRIVPGPDGNLWFAKFNPPGQVGRITPDGAMTAMTSFTEGNVEDVIVGPDGNIWFTRPFAPGGGKIGRVTPGGTVTEFTPPNADPQPRNMAVGSDGNIWYTDDGGDPNVGLILRTTTDGTITPVAESGVTPGFGGGFFAYAITLGPDGNIWTVLRGGGPAVARVTPAGAVTLFAEPGMGLLEDIVQACGDLFISQMIEDESTPAIWRLTTAGAFTEYTAGLPANLSPRGLTQGADQDLWIAGTGEPSRILTMGAGCTDTPPTSTPTTARSAPAVAPRFTG